MVNAPEDAERWRAPGPLEDVRRFLNTWEYVTGTRETRDHLAALARHGGEWRGRFENVRRPKDSELEALVTLRSGLRDAVERELDVRWLNEQLAAVGLTVAVARGPDGNARVRSVPLGEPTAVADLLALVVEAIRDGTWRRLKACPDCQLVFFDRTRNASKRWCQMSAREGGRACGSIAKVRNWRARKGGPHE